MLYLRYKNVYVASKQDFGSSFCNDEHCVGKKGAGLVNMLENTSWWAKMPEVELTFCGKILNQQYFTWLFE